MKISIVGPSYPFRGGISHYTTLLYINLKKKHETQFYAFKRQYPRWLFPGSADKDNSANPIGEESVENILDSMNPLTWLKVFIKIKKENSALVIFPWWVSFWTPHFWTIATLIKKLTRAKILFICHNVVEHESNTINKICARFVLKKGDYFIVHSGEDLENLKKIRPDANVKQSFHPTYEVFRSEYITKDDARKRLNLDGNTIFFFGFVRPYKGLNYMIDAMPTIIKHVDASLLIVGEFWEGEDKYREQIERLGIEVKVKIINKYIPNEEVGVYFSAADVVVLPYISGTGSGIVQIAFGFNKPVIATKAGCLPEVVDHGRTGYLVEPMDSQAIADAVVSFYNEGKEDEFVNNIKRGKDRFSWDRMVETIENFARDKSSN